MCHTNSELIHLDKYNLGKDNTTMHCSKLKNQGKRREVSVIYIFRLKSSDMKYKSHLKLILKWSSASDTLCVPWGLWQATGTRQSSLIWGLWWGSQPPVCCPLWSTHNTTLYLKPGPQVTVHCRKHTEMIKPSFQVPGL